MSKHSIKEAPGNVLNESLFVSFWPGWESGWQGFLLFSFLPVPFSAVMVERQLGTWLRGDFSYVAHSDWVGHDDISPWMGLAVIASEDQKFPTHWGFDVAAIESVLDNSDSRMRGASTLSQQTAKICFSGTDVAGFAKGWRRA